MKIMSNSLYSMKWHSFLTRFALIASAVVHGLIAFMTLFPLLGSFIFGQDVVLAGIPESQHSITMTFLAFSCIVTAIKAGYSVHVRSQLASFSAQAPGKLLKLYRINIVACLLMIIETRDFSLLPIIAVQAVVNHLTKRYYTRRASLFVC